MYEKLIRGELGADVRVVDLRTDTISKLTREMREAMYAAEVGDDVYGEDPTVLELERRAAELMGKEDAMFVVSGTMANLIAMMVHCPQRGSEILAGDMSHIVHLEQGGAAQIAGIQTCTLANKEDGTFDLDDLRRKIRKHPDIHESISSLIIVENTHNICGGKVVPMDWLDKVCSIAAEHGIPVHMDGARVLNAAAYLKVPPHRITRDVESVCFCLTKGLGCPVGSMLCGSATFVDRGRRFRKVLGGGWRQAGVLAAAGLVALDTMVDRLKIDHEHAYKVAKAIHNMRSSIFKVDLSTVQSNIFVVYLDCSKVEIKTLQKRLQTVLETDEVKVSVRCSSLNYRCVRFVFYHEITSEDVQLAIKKIQLVIREFDEQFKI